MSSAWCLEAAAFYLHVSTPMTEKKFRQLIGGPSAAVECLYFWILKKNADLPQWWRPTAFFLTLHWMKNPYSSFGAFCNLNDVSENTMWQYIKKTLELINKTLPDLSLSDRYDKWNFPAPCAVIDTKTFQIWQPSDRSWQYLIGRNTYGVKYELVCSIGVPRFIWCSGPYKGVASDATIPLQSGLLGNFSQHEALLADKIYKGNRNLFLCPLPGNYYSLSQEEKSYNFLIYSARQCIERMISRLTVFGVFQISWKYSFALHGLLVQTACKMVNLFLLFEPLG